MTQANVVNTLIVPAESRLIPYYDDFDESKNFHRIMFRPGYAVQARELTQLQTILQNQVERFGRHIFVNGSPVIGGNIDLADVTTINLSPTYANSDIDVSVFLDKTIVDEGNTAMARVIQVSAAIGDEPPCLHVRYLSGSEFGAANTITTTYGSHSANVAASGHTANGSVAFIYDSIYFMQGYFIKAPKQNVVLSKFNRSANSKIGLEFQDSIITEKDDASLLDPALETSNYLAPGAARYQAELVLNTRAPSSTDDEKFIKLADVENGVIIRNFTKPVYSEIEEVLARRTYDTNGNYIVRPFKAKVEDSITDPANNYVLAISPGKAYVYGYEAENQATTRLELPKARDTKSKSNYNIKMNFGNYVIVQDLKGTFNTNRQGIVDLHCVDAANVVTTTNTTYQSTKIGTARVRDIEFYGGGTDASNTRLRQFEFYFYDNKFRTISDTANTISSTLPTNQIGLKYANSSAVTDAYTGAYIKIISGNSAGDLRLITKYDGASKIANVSVPFTANTDETSVYELRFDITDVDGIVQSTVYTPAAGSYGNATATISLSNKDDGTYNGNTFISEPTFSDALWPYPVSYVAPGISDISYSYRKVFSSVNFSSGVATITAASNEQFEGSDTTSNVSSSVMDNFLVVVTNSTGSARTVGDQVKIISTVNELASPETVTLNTSNTSESFTATVYTKVRITNPAPRSKTLIIANTTTFTSSSPSAMFDNPTGSNTKVYLTAGQVVIKNPDPRGESLFITDVIGVSKVYFSDTAPAAGDLLSSYADVTANYVIDRGHKNEYYDHATISLKPGLPSKPGYIIVCLRYYSHTNDTGFFSVDSYLTTDDLVYEGDTPLTTRYALIPTVNKVRMADQIDFRPVRPNAANTNTWTFDTARCPLVLSDFTSDFSYYVERRDIIVMTVNDELKLVQGNINNKTSYPDSPSRSLTLHRLRVLPYTVTKNDIIIDTLDHRRYTMADIGGIDKRLKYIEYTTSLNTLEKSAKDIVIKDVNGLDRTKYGILAEDFSSHLLGDVNNPDYSCAVDISGVFSPTGGVLMPRVMTNYIKLDANNASATGVSIFDDKIMLAYKTSAAITQDTATKSTPLSDYLFADFRGQVITVPDADQWKDTTYLPDEVISLPQPVIKFDITATDITNITNNNTVNNTTTVNNPPPQEATPVVERLLLAAQGGVLDHLGSDLTWTGGQTFAPGSTSWQGFHANYSAYPPDIDGTAMNTVGMSRLQLYSIVKNVLDNTGYSDSLGNSASAGILGVGNTQIQEVYDLYVVTLNRPPDLAGLAWWCMYKQLANVDTQRLRETITQSAAHWPDSYELSGVPESVNLTPKYIVNADMSAAIIRDTDVQVSPDAGNFETTKTPDGRNTALGGSDEQFIKAMYRNYLGREAESAGFQWWLNQLQEWERQYGRNQAISLVEQGFKESVERTAKGGSNYNNQYGLT